ncbi:collagen-like protein [uncultured Maribacter sp.]|uniref:collagen-like protein n=1 Tax=uncultured Maribacter sp. TaxID=431308 RepID=UPI002613BB08|nr:collagen-like protein [uncultured Maribacter sp.]
MKKIGAYIIVILSLITIACEGPQGPPGFDGFDGEDGIDAEQNRVFEIDNVNFNYDSDANIFDTIITFSDFFNDNQFEVLSRDAVLVYRYDGTVDFADGSSEDAWSLIPQSFFVNEGTIQYTNSHTSKDVQIFIDGNFNLANISTEFTDNQLFRVVFIPNSALEVSKLDTSNLEAVLSTLNIKEADIKKVP